MMVMFLWFCCQLWSIHPTTVSARVPEQYCQFGFYYNLSSAVCKQCEKCPPGTEPRKYCDGYTTMPSDCVPCSIGKFSSTYSVEKCSEFKICPKYGFSTLQIGNSTHDSQCDTKCLKGHYKPKGISSWCAQCPKNKQTVVRECLEYFEEEDNKAKMASSTSNEGSSSVTIVGENATSADQDGDGTAGDNSSQTNPNHSNTTASSKGLGTIAVVVTVSIVLSVLLVGFILCFCRNRRRKRGGTNNNHNSTMTSSRANYRAGGAISTAPNCTPHSNSNYHRNIENNGFFFSICCKRPFGNNGGGANDSDSVSDYETLSQTTFCCLPLDGPMSRNKHSSKENYCIKDSSFVFRDPKSLGKSFSITNEKYYSPGMEDTHLGTQSFTDYQISPCKNISPPATLPLNHKIDQHMKKSGSGSLEKKHSLLIGDKLGDCKGKEFDDCGGGGGNKLDRSMNELEKSQQRVTTANEIGQFDSCDYSDTQPGDYTRLGRQESVIKTEEQLREEKLKNAQLNAHKLRHVSPTRLRSASETIFGTSDGKETILDLLQTKEPEQILALKIELISQIYEGLLLNGLSAEIVREMKLEMEKLSQYVSSNLGRAFIDIFNLKIKTKSITCAQLLAKTFKHRGSQISVAQLLHFLHQYGDRHVAEAFCDLLIRWYRYETSNNKQQQQQPGATHSNSNSSLSHSHSSSINNCSNNIHLQNLQQRLYANNDTAIANHNATTTLLTPPSFSAPNTSSVISQQTNTCNMYSSNASSCSQAAAAGDPMLKLPINNYVPLHSHSQQQLSCAPNYNTNQNSVTVNAAVALNSPQQPQMYYPTTTANVATAPSNAISSNMFNHYMMAQKPPGGHPIGVTAKETPLYSSQVKTTEDLNSEYGEDDVFD